MADTPKPAAPTKALVFARRSASTLILWALVAWVFMSRWSWACLALIGVLAILATVEYFRMLRAAGVGCFPRFGILLAAGYCGALYASFLRGRMPSPDLDALAIFIALAGSFSLQLRHPIRGAEPVLAVAANVLGFISITFFFNFTARLLFFVPGPYGNVSSGVGETQAHLNALFMIPGPSPAPGVMGGHGALSLIHI